MNQNTEHSDLDYKARAANAIAACDRMLARLDEWEELDKKKSKSLFKRVFSLA